MSRIKIHSYGDKGISFFNIDQHAYKASVKDASDFPTLIKYLRRKIPRQTGNQKLFLARGIIAWLSYALTTYKSHRNIRISYKEPIVMVQAMANQQIPHAEVFKVFCDAASIECEIILGRCKAVAYRAGDSDNTYLSKEHSWNAFKADGQWHLVHPTWVLHAVSNYSRGGEIELVGGTHNVLTRLPHFGGTHSHVFNDFWFCTNPEIFGARCLPNVSEWQLLPKQKVVDSVDKFLELPDVRQGFYRTRLHLLTEQACRLQAKNGRCLIAFSADQKTARRLQFTYQLTLVHGDIPDVDIDALSKCIYHSKPGGNIFNFEVRFLFTGTFRLNVKVGYIHERLKRTCGEFLIECDKVDENCKALPIDAGEVGWGPGTASDDAGIKGSSEDTGKVLLLPSTTDSSKYVRTITLKTREDDLTEKIYETTVCGSDEVDDEDISVEVPGKVRVDHDQSRIELDVETVGDRERALRVTARNRNSPAQSATTVLNYLLITKEAECDKDERKGLKQKERKARRDFKEKEKCELKNSLKNSFTMLKQEVDGYGSGRKAPRDAVSGLRRKENEEPPSKVCRVS